MPDAATLRAGGCNPAHWRLQPCALEAATLRISQAELSLLWGRPATEAEACTSVVQSCAPGGFMRSYIEEGARHPT